MKKNISSHVNNYFFHENNSPKEAKCASEGTCFVWLLGDEYWVMMLSAHLREHVLLECWVMNVG